MRSLFQRILSGALLIVDFQSIGVCCTDPEFMQENRHNSKPRPRPRRRRLEPADNIVDVINEEISKGVKHPRFTLTAAFEDTTQQSRLRRFYTRNSDTTPEPFTVDVVLTDPSITEATSFSVDGGESKLTNSSSTTKFLVADHNTDSSSSFAILVVDLESGSVKGIVQKDQQLVKWVQDAGEAAVVSDASFNPPSDWTCSATGTVVGRNLEENHDHSSHDYDHDSYHDFNLANVKNFTNQLGIERMNLQNRRRIYATDDWPNEYSYMVDLYIEVDTAMVTNHDPSDAANMPNTINYINALITGKLVIISKSSWCAEAHESMNSPLL